MKKTLLVISLCALVAAFTPTLRADTFGQAFSGAAVGSPLGNGPFTLGWMFDVSSTINVTSLAVYHDNGSALLESHEVGIWDSAGNLMGSTTVQAGGCSSVADQIGAQTWCTAAVSFQLTPGTYTIGAVWNSLLDNMIFDGTLLSEGLTNVNGPNVSMIENAFIAGGFADPTNTTGDTMSYFGPNFSYTTGTQTPEPSSLLLLGSGLLGVVGVIRRKINV